MNDAAEVIAFTYAAIYPGAPHEWLIRAAEETIWFSAMHSEPSHNEIAVHDARIRNMCMTGAW